MPKECELDSKLRDLGIFDENLCLVEKQKRFARFEGTTFGIAPKN
jgi:hypothetical protein